MNMEKLGIKKEGHVEFSTTKKGDIPIWKIQETKIKQEKNKNGKYETRTCAFTMTQGKSGTQYLARILSLVEECIALHEPDWNFLNEGVIRGINRGRKDVLEEKWRKKLPIILDRARDNVYVECDQIFIKSFCGKAAKDLENIKIIDLYREPAKIARSICNAGFLVEHNSWNTGMFLDPRLPENITYLDYGNSKPIERCIWYVFEIEERKKRFKERYPDIPVFLFNMETKDEKMWLDFLSFLGLKSNDKFLETVRKDPIINSWENRQDLKKKRPCTNHSLEEVRRSVEEYKMVLKKDMKENDIRRVDKDRSVIIKIPKRLKDNSVGDSLKNILKSDNLFFIDSNVEKLEDTVFFGPWVGEFGFEIMWWQGFCRKMSRNFKHSIVSTFKESSGLYEDFASEIIYHELGGNRMCGFLNNARGNLIISNCDQVYIPFPKKQIFKEEQEYYKFGNKDSKDTFDILFHATEHGRKKYNYWNKLVEAFPDFKKACFGMKNCQKPDHYIDGTEDLRGIELKELAKYMAGAKVIVGPVSGAMHFASYCGAKIVVWTDAKIFTFRQKIRQRFEEKANPFNSPVIVLDEWEWNPPSDKVINAIVKFL